MASELKYKGKVSVGVIVPIALGLTGAATATIPDEIASLQALLAAAPKLVARLAVMPPSLAANLAAALQILGQITAAVGVSPPSASLQGVAALGLAAKLTARIAPLEKALAIAAEVTGFEEQAGVVALVYEGPLRHLAAEARARLGANPAAPLYIPILVCDTPEARAAASKAFRVS